MATVYEAYSRRVVFQGSHDEALRWILDQAYAMRDGTKIYRTWKSDGDTYYDVGRVYILNG